MNAHQKIIKDNVRSILKIITNHYGVKYSAALYQILKEHPDFPSFLSFQYILHRMGKDSFAIHTSYEELTNMPAPFIVHGVTNVDLFLFITKATAESVQIIDEKGKEESIKRHYKIFCVNVKYGIQYGFRIFYLIALQNEENYEREESCSA